MNKVELFALKLIEGVGDKSIFNIIGKYGDETITNDTDLQGLIKGSKKDAALASFKEHYHEYVERATIDLEEYDRNGIHVISYLDDQYPQVLKEIKNPPLFLFCKGNVDLLYHQNSIAVIGTREATETGYEIGKRTAMYFAKQGFCIVSGLALGIDTSGHEGALEVGGKTIAFVVDVLNIFPTENEDLAKRILENDGLLVAENKPGTYPNRGAFVARDRFQSAFSLAIFPIETDVVGGTMHTVGFAQEQERLIYCPDLSKLKKEYIEGNDKARGIHKLLKEGTAKPFTSSSYDTILVELEEKRREIYPLKVIILDLDQTLIDSSSVEQLRKDRNWKEVYPLIPKLPVYDGINEVFKWLYDNNIHIAIVTKTPGTYCEKVIKANGWLIKESVCYHDVKIQKPDPEGMLLALDKLKAGKKCVLTVGDSVNDILASKNAGLKSVAALWGTEEKEKLEACDADYKCHTPQELLQVVKVFFG